MKKKSAQSCTTYFLTTPKFFLLLLPAGLLITGLAGAETLVGTVMSTGENQFVLQEIQTEKTALLPREFQVIFVPATERGRFAAGPAFPRCVRTGKTVRVSGQFDPGKNVFLAREIRGVPGRGRHHDPTGVRGRLGRCRHSSGTDNE